MVANFYEDLRKLCGIRSDCGPITLIPPIYYSSYIYLLLALVLVLVLYWYMLSYLYIPLLFLYMPYFNLFYPDIPYPLLPNESTMTVG